MPLLVACGILFLAGSWLEADVIDRMMAVVDGRVVTLSDVNEYREIAVLFGDLIPESDAAVLDQVIENILIRAQIDQFPGIRVREEEVTAMIQQTGEGGLPSDVLRDAVRARLMRARYFARRFVQQVTDAEISEYYESVFVPAAEARALDPIPPLADVQELIRTNVITERADEEISVWVESLHRRSQVEVVE